MHETASGHAQYAGLSCVNLNFCYFSTASVAPIRAEGALLNYSGNPLIRSSTDQTKLAVLTGFFG